MSYEGNTVEFSIRCDGKEERLSWVGKSDEQERKKEESCYGNEKKLKLKREN